MSYTKLPARRQANFAGAFPADFISRVSPLCSPIFRPRSLELDDQIGLDGKDGYPWVYCSFDEDQVETAEALEMGQIMTFRCVGSDNWSIGPTLKNCVLINAR